MSSLGPLEPDHNPFADDSDEELNTDKTALAATAAINDHGAHPLKAQDGHVSDAKLAGLQQQHWDDQDQHLDALTASLNRQHEMSLQMNDELDLHHELLEGFDRDADNTGLRLGGASNQLEHLRNSLKDHGKFTQLVHSTTDAPRPVLTTLRFLRSFFPGIIWVLGALIVTLIILIAFFKK